MGIVLVFVEGQPDGSLRKATLHAVNAATQIAQKGGHEVHAIALAKDATALANAHQRFWRESGACRQCASF